MSIGCEQVRLLCYHTYMKRVQTTNFSLAMYSIGSPDSPKVALILPGFLDTKDYAHIHGHADFLASRGYFAVAVDMPGTWESGGKIEDYTLTNCIQAVDELVAKFDRPTLLVGHSNGGRIAFYVAAKNSRVSGVVAIMSPLFVRKSTSKKESIRKWMQDGSRTYTMDVPGDPSATREFTIPFSFIEDSEKYQPSKLLATLTVPKLFIAGRDDHVITASEVKKSYDRSASPKRYETVAAPHIYRGDPAIIQSIHAHIASFLDEQLT